MGIMIDISINQVSYTSYQKLYKEMIRIVKIQPINLKKILFYNLKFALYFSNIYIIYKIKF